MWRWQNWHFPKAYGAMYARWIVRSEDTLLQPGIYPVQLTVQSI